MNRRTRLKVCGLTRKDQALAAASQGVDSIGLVFHQSSPRALELDTGLAIRQAMPPFVTVTALFLDESEDWVAQIVHQLRPDCLQFHGREPEEFCAAWMIPYIKAIPMGSDVNPHAYARQYPSAQGFLLDSNVAGRLGGSGDTFDWSKIPTSFDAPLILAGGLTPSNVAEAITRIRPWGVDVSSGVEISKGIKSAQLIEQMLHEIAQGDANVGNDRQESK